MHRRYGGYDYFEFRYEVENIRIEARESRDLLQDLADIAAGIEVIHQSDLEKAAKVKKREDREKRKEYKKRRLERRDPAHHEAEQMTMF